MSEDRASEDPLGLSVHDLSVTFGDHVALDDVSLGVAPGEILALVGPSGCGKSTLLRVIAGLEVPVSGSVSWDGVVQDRTPAHRRGFGLMFQDHALFPHRSVGENVAFGLRMAKAPVGEQRRRTEEVLALVGLDGYQDRTIGTLSGGEAQRVALARALAPSPRLLMLDEPLGSLDRRLRDRLAQDLRTILTELGLAAIHVTHDQDEAFAVADRMAVMGAGRLRRCGPVAAVWHDPGDPVTARFLGHDNVLDDGAAHALGLTAAAGPVLVPDAAITLETGSTGRAASDAGTRSPHPGRITDVRFAGRAWRVQVLVTLPDTRSTSVGLIVFCAQPLPVGADVGVDIDPDRVVALRSP